MYYVKLTSIWTRPFDKSSKTERKCAFWEKQPQDEKQVIEKIKNELRSLTKDKKYTRS